jgi:hypothetical protein
VIEFLPPFTGARCARPALVESISDRSEAQDYLAKAQESLHGTASELAHQHFTEEGGSLNIVHYGGDDHVIPKDLDPDRGLGRRTGRRR